MRRELLSTARPTPLRLAGFVAAAAGGLLIGMGALLPWARISYLGLPAVDVPGVDLGEGRATLAVGLVVLAAIPLSRLSARRTRWAWLLVAAGLAACSLGLAGILVDEARLGGPSAGRLARELARSTGLPEGELRARLEATAPDVRRGPGAPLAAAGGMLAAVGGGLTAAWSRSAGRGGGSLGPHRRG